MSFSQKLCYLMDNPKISAYKMSKETGISDRLIGYWRKGEMMPNAENLIIIADYFNTSVDYLLDRNVNNIRTTNVQKATNSSFGDNSPVTNNQSTIDGISKELLGKFEVLNFNDKIKVMSLVAELSEKEGA